MLQGNWSRSVPYSLDELKERVLVYTDAESNGYTATMIITSSLRLCYHGRIPYTLYRRLKRRRTQIVAYELIAGIMGALQIKNLEIASASVRHFIDSNPARQCMVKAASKQEDLNELSGMLWFVGGRTLRNYYCQYVASKLNLADAPSRGQFSDMRRLNAQLTSTDFYECDTAVDSWMACMQVHALVT